MAAALRVVSMTLTPEEPHAFSLEEEHLTTGTENPFVTDYNEEDTVECLSESALRDEYVTSWKFIVPTILLTVFCVVVIGGNLLVILSVFTCRKLRTITNTYVVSLAFADLMLGFLVVPFSGTLAVLRFWPFGRIWCYTYLAIDVWLCTASILNLVVISFDRFLAISKPFKYQTMMSPLKAKLLVGAVWIIAFLICCPPLIGWNERGQPLTEDVEESTSATPPNHVVNAPADTTHSYHSQFYYSNSTSANIYDFNASEITYSNVSILDNCEEAPQCSLNLESGYVIYSALGSFWIPVWIMAFFYGRIYLIAARTTRGVRRGVLRTRNNSNNTNQVTLRIHRGGSSASTSYRSDSQTESLICGSPQINSRRNSTLSNSPSMRKNSNISLRHGLRKSSLCDSPTTYKAIRSNSADGAIQHTHQKDTKNTPKVKVTFYNPNNNNSEPKLMRSSCSSPKRKSSTPNGHLKHCIIEEEDEETSFTEQNGECQYLNPDANNHNGLSHNDSVLNRLGSKLNIKNRLKNFNREKKAAKTVGIIVGCFIICWAPFFTVYLLTAFCEHCTPEIVFTIFFWLGYCNSAINPCVYALFSKDFRFAFKRLLCCRCERHRPSFRDRRKSRFRSFINSLRIQISSRSSDDNNDNTVMEA